VGISTGFVRDGAMIIRVSFIVTSSSAVVADKKVVPSTAEVEVPRYVTIIRKHKETELTIFIHGLDTYRINCVEDKE
jgi:hypothetical protein